MGSPFRWLLLPLQVFCATASLAAAPVADKLLSTIPGQAASGDAAAVAPLSGSEIPSRADADEQFARDVLHRVSQTGATQALERRIDELAANVVTLDRRMRAEDFTRMPVLRIESLRRNWRFQDTELELWQRDAQRQLDQYSADAAQLASRRAVWDATRKQARDTAVAPALLVRIGEVLRQIDAADRAIAAPLERRLGLGRRGNTLKSSIDAGLRKLDDASTNFNVRLSVRGSPPLWAAWSDPRYSDAARSAAATTADLELDFLQRYIRASTEKLWVHAAFAVFLLPTLLWLRHRSLKLVAADPLLAPATQALMRPLSSWLVLVLLATLFLQAGAPMLLNEAALLLAVIPVLRLLPRQIFDALGPWPYAATALYVLQRLGFLFVAQPLWYRVHLLVVTLLTLAALAWIILQARRRRPVAHATALERTARAAGALGVIALIVSAVANLFGNVTLAELLTRGTLDSAYYGLVLYAGATVLGSIMRLLRARRAASRLQAVTAHTGPLLQTAARLVNYGAVAAWVLLTLNEFRVLQPIVDWARGVLTYAINVGAISLTLGSVLLFAIAVYVAFWVARTTRTILRDEVLGRLPLPRGVANSVSTLTYYALVLLGLLIALAAAGFEVGQLAIVVGALGVGIGFGLQNVVNNFVSGLILMFERPIQPGDVVEITGTTGTVREIGMRATTLTTPEGADVVVPNGTLLSEKLVNWTLSDMNRRVDVDLSIALGSDARQVLELLKRVTVATDGIAAQPEPVVLVTGLGASSLNVGIRAWTNDFNNWVTIRSNLTIRVYDALIEAGIEIPFPRQDLHIRSVPKELVAAEEPRKPAPSAQAVRADPASSA
jgi:potassium-dependent mechanosensitive channel